MAFTDPALPGVESPAEPPRPASLRKRALIVGVALVGASAITASPATAAVPALASAKAYEVQLAAAVDPLATWQSTFEKAFGHIQYGLNEMGTLYPVLGQELLQVAPAVLQELGGVLTNVGGWQQVMNNLPGYAERIQAAIEAGQEPDPNAPDLDFNQTLQNISGYIQNLQFNYAFAELNSFVLWSAGSGAWPLLRELTIGTEILQTLGAHRLAGAWDTLFVGPDGQGGVVTDLTMFVFGPVVTAAMAFTEGLDDIAAAAVANDWENTAAELLNLAPKTLDAFLNGHSPRVAGIDWDWAGILTNRGTLEALLFSLPRDLTWGLLNPLVPEESETAELTGLPEAASTRLAAMKNLLNLDLGALVPGAESDEDVAESGTVVEKVIDKIVNGEETTETVEGEETAETVDGEETTDSETAPVVTKPVEETAPVKETTPVEGVVEETPVLQDKAETPAESAKTGLDNTKNKIRSIRNKLADRFGGKGDSSKPSSSKPGSGSSDSDSSESKSDKSDSGKTESGSSTDKSKSDSKSGSDSSKSSSAKSSSGSDSKSDRGSDSKRKSKSSDSD